MLEGSDQIYQGGDGTALRFFTAPVKNNFQSEKNGRPIFDTALYVEVMTPGSTESIPQFEVERTYCVEAGVDAHGNRLVERSPKYAQYEPQVEAFKRQTGDHLAAGTPINQWAQIDVGTAASLKAAGIHTVEMLAGVSDTSLGNLGVGGRVMRDQARAFIQTQQFGVPTAAMAAESANLRDENIRLTNALNDATQRLASAHAEIAAMRTGNPAYNNGNVTSATVDPFSMNTPSQPDPNSSMQTNSASPLTPTEGDAGKGAEQRVEQGGPLNFTSPGTPNSAPPPPQGTPPLI